MTRKEPSTEDQLKVLQAVYEHLRCTRQDEEAYYSIYLQKVHRLLMIHALLFASMSFALSQLEWVKGLGSIHLWILGTFAILGAASLGVAFFYGVKCLGIEEFSVLGVSHLHELVKNESIRKLRPDELFEDLSQNACTTVTENRARAESRKSWGRVLTKYTLAGFVFVAFFLAYAIIGKVSSSVVSNKTQENRMSDNPNNDAPTDGGQESVAQEAQSASDSADRPSAVEPSHTGQRSDVQVRPSAVESPVTIALSHDHIIKKDSDGS